MTRGELLTFPMAPAPPGDEEEDKVGEDRDQAKDAGEGYQNLQEEHVMYARRQFTFTLICISKKEKAESEPGIGVTSENALRRGQD